jgi:hypothetical protein
MSAALGDQLHREAAVTQSLSLLTLIVTTVAVAEPGVAWEQVLLPFRAMYHHSLQVPAFASVCAAALFSLNVHSPQGAYALGYLDIKCHLRASLQAVFMTVAYNNLVRLPMAAYKLHKRC